MQPAPRRWLIAAGILGLVGVAAGAFGAHGLANRLDTVRLATWETAARYQLLHAIALIGVAWLASRPDSGRAVAAAGWAFAAGASIFSGALYAVALSGARWPGSVAPIGGALLLAGWAALIWHGIRLGRGTPPKP